MWEAFRRAGFASEQIFVGRANQGQFAVILPDLHYGWLVTPDGIDPLALATLPMEEFVTEWQEAANLWNELSAKNDPLIEETWAGSEVYRDKVIFMNAMVSSGIALPCTADC